MTPQFKYTLRMRRKSKAHQVSTAQINLKTTRIRKQKSKEHYISEEKFHFAKNAPNKLLR